MLKGQDIVVLAALTDGERPGETYASLGKRVRLSAAETHAAVKRLVEASLLGADRRVLRRNALEFLVHGIRYAFPLRPAGLAANGLATAYAAPVAKDAFASTGLVPVWRTPAGTTFGQAFEPLYATAPEAAAQNTALYDRLALIDMLRGGRLRERQFAERKIAEMLP